MNAQQCATIRKNEVLTEGGQGICKGLLAELHIFIFAWLNPAEKLVMERFAPQESLGDYTQSDCPHSGDKQIRRSQGQFTGRSFPNPAPSLGTPVDFISMPTMELD